MSASAEESETYLAERLSSSHAAASMRVRIPSKFELTLIHGLSLSSATLRNHGNGNRQRACWLMDSLPAATTPPTRKLSRHCFLRTGLLAVNCEGAVLIWHFYLAQVRDAAKNTGEL
eukprot:SAG31_NODE_3205_length_4555_cov_4.933348_2_plen_117_part_00